MTVWVLVMHFIFMGHGFNIYGGVFAAQADCLRFAAAEQPKVHSRLECVAADVKVYP